jgi:hypothetical protein
MSKGVSVSIVTFGNKRATRYRLKTEICSNVSKNRSLTSTYTLGKQKDMLLLKESITSANSSQV